MTVDAEREAAEVASDLMAEIGYDAWDAVRSMMGFMVRRGVADDYLAELRAEAEQESAEYADD